MAKKKNKTIKPKKESINPAVEKFTSDRKNTAGDTNHDESRKNLDKEISNQKKAGSKKLEKHYESVVMSIIAALIVALASGFVNYNIWGIQRSSELNEKMFDEKIKLMENVSKYMIEYDHLRRDLIKYSLAVNIEMQNNKNIKLEDKYILEQRLQKFYPREYASSLKAKEILPKLVSNLVLCQVFFGDKTKKTINKFNIIISKSTEEYVAEYVENEKSTGVAENNLFKKDNEGNIFVEFNDSEIEKLVHDDMENLLNEMVNAMRNEL